MNIIAWIILGALAGWLGAKVIEGANSQGLVRNILVGIAGAIIGGFIFELFGGAGITGFNLYSLFVAIIGSATLLWIMQLGSSSASSSGAGKKKKR
jgi:uncharacterized membrane protein YeaQ/YmgE (transglycosylase-associated protein family)